MQNQQTKYMVRIYLRIIMVMLLNLVLDLQKKQIKNRQKK